MKIIIILVTRFIHFIGKLLNRGNCFPGQIALKLDKNIIKKLKLPKDIIVVTGSSGKGTVTNMINDIILKNNKSTTCNNAGSNLLNGIATTLLTNCNLKGKINSDYLVLEVDERFCNIIFKLFKPSFIIITNITKDQPPRNFHFDNISNILMNAIDKKTKLILNADDPYMQEFQINNYKNIIYFGIDDKKCNLLPKEFLNLNYSYCPKCYTKLIYDKYFFESYGHYRCPNNDFSRPIPDISISKINKDSLIIDNVNIELDTSIYYNMYNILAALAIIKELGLKFNDNLEIIKNDKIFDVYKFKNKNIVFLNNKCENSISFNHSIIKCHNDKKKKSIIIGWNKISGRYNFEDLSWLYDIHFELLQNDNIENIICAGPHSHDIANRLKYANINKKIIKTFVNIEDGIKYALEKSKCDIYAVINYDIVPLFKKHIKESK